MPLVAHYPLHEDSGSTAYDVRGGKDGTTNGGVTQGVNGILGTTAYDFDGTDDYVSAPDSAAFDISPQISISAWIKGSNLHSGSSIVSRYEASGSNYMWLLRLDGTNDINLLIADSSGTQVNVSSTDGNLDDGGWHFVTVVYDSGVFELYIDGVLDNSSDESGTITDINTGTKAIDISAREDGSGSKVDYFDGGIADVRVYDHALSAAEVQYLYEVSDHGSQVSSVKSL